ncbi:MAG: hypothetical protein V4517_04315 [Pseudomonadota bacterium]
MNDRRMCIAMAVAVTLCGSAAKADAPKEIKAESGKPVVLGNFLSAPANCGSNPGPVPLPKLREKPSHGGVGLQIVIADVAATDACPARKIPSIAMFYVPSKDFVGKDSLQIEFEAGDKKMPIQSFLITVQAPDGK